MRIRRLSHSIYQVQYHIVWGTKYRRKWLKHYVRTELIKSLFQLQKAYPTWYFHQINTGDDHVHLRMEIPPDNSIAEVVQKLKGHSSVALKKRFPFVQQIYPDRGIWSVGYFVSTIGLNEEAIKKYIAIQNQYDRGTDLTTEFS